MITVLVKKVKRLVKGYDWKQGLGFEVSDQDSRAGKEGTFCSGVIFCLRRNILGAGFLNSRLFVNHNTHGEEDDEEAVKIRRLKLQICELCY
nr:hypothetical protein [Tanacetum cinerariifolium]